jgi:hypothetical protein
LRLNKFNETTMRKLLRSLVPGQTAQIPTAKLNSARCAAHQLMIGLKTRRINNNTIEITMTDGVRPSLADRLAFDYTTKRTTKMNVNDNMILTIRDVLQMHCRERGRQYPCTHGSILHDDETNCFLALKLFNEMALNISECRRWSKK